MSMQRKITILTVFLLCFVLFSGCSANPNKEQTSTKDQSAEESVTNEGSVTDKETVTSTGNQQFSSDADASIDALREEIGENKARFGMAYIGYFDGADGTDIDFGQWFYSASSPLAAEYPFVSEIDEAHTVGTEGHLYCIIAGDCESSISVSRIGDDKPLCSVENGDPILVFCNIDGDAKKADTVVTVKVADGTEYRWEPTLDEMGFPNLLIGNERELLSWDFTLIPDTGFDLESWISEGWLAPTAVGLAYDKDGRCWWISTWDNSVSYCLSFYLNGGGSYDGEVVLECFYKNQSTVQANWQGWWRIETETEQSCRLYLDMMLMNGADMAAFENATIVSESYPALVSGSGNNLLLVADGDGTILPIFPEGVQAIELTLAAG